MTILLRQNDPRVDVSPQSHPSRWLRDPRGESYFAILTEVSDRG